MKPIVRCNIAVYILVITPSVLISSSLSFYSFFSILFENRVLRRIFGTKRDEGTGDWRKLHNKELHNFYSTPSIIRMIKSRRMR
jgi:hypothetical protein